MESINDSAFGLENPVLVLELNELCPPILRKLMEEGRLPNFAELLAVSKPMITKAEDESLEPWVQWVTLHTGKNQREHGAMQLDEGHLIKTDRIWDVLAENGATSLIFASMNSSTSHPETVELVPDYWSGSSTVSDEKFADTYSFICSKVLNHTDKNTKTSMWEQLSAVLSLLRFGVKPSTLASGMHLLVLEKLSNKDRRWKRAIFLDQMMWDMFSTKWKKRRPNFATFFANSTAFLQHRYWRHMSPDEYQVRPSSIEMSAYGDAIESSYVEMDRLVGRARRLLGKNGKLVFATALSQEANLKYEDIGGKFVYRPIECGAFLKKIGSPQPLAIDPVMTHQFWATFDSDQDAILADEALDRVTLDSRKLMNHYRSDNRVFFDCSLKSTVPDTSVFGVGEKGDVLGFLDYFYLIGQVNNSQHNPLGILWRPLREGETREEQEVPLEHGFHEILNLFVTPKGF